MSRENWEVLTEYMAILAPFKEVTKELEGIPERDSRSKGDGRRALERVRANRSGGTYGTSAAVTAGAEWLSSSASVTSARAHRRGRGG